MPSPGAARDPRGRPHDDRHGNERAQARGQRCTRRPALEHEETVRDPDTRVRPPELVEDGLPDHRFRCERDERPGHERERRQGAGRPRDDRSDLATIDRPRPHPPRHHEQGCALPQLDRHREAKRSTRRHRTGDPHPTGPGDHEQREEHERVLGRVQVRAPFADSRDVPGRVEPRCEQAGHAAVPTRDEAGKHRVQRAQRHDRQASGREGRRIADHRPEKRERHEEHDHPWRVEQQHVAVRELAVDQRDRCPEVDAVVIGQVPVEPATDEDRNSTDEEARRPRWRRGSLRRV